MLDLLYRASFFLYEVSFIMFAWLLGTYGESLRRLSRSLHQPPYWIFTAFSSLLMLGCAVLHFYVYHFLSPQYLQTGTHEQLILMYILKFVSMASIFMAGLALALGNGLYLKTISR